MAGGERGTGADPGVERLIDQGLDRYGKGDLDGALLAWESALALDPRDARAAGYVDYVRGHYELLRGGGGAQADSELAVPFGLAALADDDAYEIELSSAEQRARVEAFIDRVDRVDDGWFLDEDAALPAVARPLPLPAVPQRDDRVVPETLELEADEPGPGDAASWAGEDDQTRDFGLGGRGGRGGLGGLGGLGAAGRGGGAALGFDHSGDADGGPDGGTIDDFIGPPTGDYAPVSRRASSAEPTEERPPAGLVGAAGAAGAPGSLDLGDLGGGHFDFDTSDDQTSELKGRHLGFVRLSAEPADPLAQRPGAGFGPELTTSELKGVRARTATQPPRPSLEPAAPTPDPAADLELPEPSASTESTGDLPLGGGAGALGDDERTTERAQWARARSPIGGSALDHLDLDDGGSSSIAPPVIIESAGPEIHPFDPVHRNMPTRELPIVRAAAKAPAAGPASEPRPGGELRPEPRGELRGDARPDPRGEKTERLSPRQGRLAVPPAPAGAPPAPVSALSAELDAGAPAGEAPDDRTRRRITALLDRAAAATAAGRHADAVAAVDLALAESPDSAVAQKLVHRSRDAIVAAYLGFLGDLGARPSLAVPMHELPREQLDTRAAFLLSRVDGTMTFEEILDVSGMTRLEALRHLAKLVGRGILAVR